MIAVRRSAWERRAALGLPLATGAFSLLAVLMVVWTAAQVLDAVGGTDVGPAVSARMLVRAGLMVAAALLSAFLVLALPVGGYRKLGSLMRQGLVNIGLLSLPARRFVGLVLLPAAVALFMWLQARPVSALLDHFAARPVADDRVVMAQHAAPLPLIAHSFVGAALLEELMFRSFVVVAARHLGPRAVWVTVVVTSVLFGLAHLQYGWHNVATAGVGGLMLAYVAARTRSLWPGVLAHGLYDAWVFIFAV